MWKIIGVAGAVVALLFGAYRIGTNSASGAAYGKGFEIGKAEGDKIGYARGIEDTNTLRDKEIVAFIAQTREAEEIQRREAIERVIEIQREDQAHVEANRKQYVEKVRDINNRAVALTERMRRAEATARNAVRGPNGGNSMPEATGLADRSFDGATYTEWLFSERGGGRVIRMARQSEELNELLELCRAEKAPR